MNKFKTIIYVSFFAIVVQAQKIQSGPMLGYSQMREVLVWVQTTSDAKIKCKYWIKGNPSVYFMTDEYLTTKSEAYTAKLIADKVLPDNIYEYQILINNKIQNVDYPLTFQSKKQWLWRKDAPDFKFALGSCTYVNDSIYDRPGKGYGANYEIFDAIYQKKPDMMIWLGDNTYLREADWDTKTGIFHRYTHSRSLKEMQPLLGSTHHYAIWDDHDYGPNDSDRSFWNKNQTLEAFKLFWGNPSFGIGEMKGAITSFQWADCEFFMLDDRFYKNVTNTNEPCGILGKQQSQWLIEALSFSKAAFKFVVVGSQFLNPVSKTEGFNQCMDEKKTILDAISTQKIKNVLFLTGDRHYSDLTYLNRNGDYTLYDFTVSPLTSGTSCAKDAETLAEYPRAEGSLICKQRNFGMIEVSGSKANRQIKLIIYDEKGVEKFSKIINFPKI